MAGIQHRPLRRTLLESGLEIHYVEEGEGPPLVFVHGGMGDWSSWAPQWAAFTAHFRCISYSRRYSSPNRNSIDSRSHSAVDEAQDLGALLSHWQAVPAILVGTSYGAFTALQLALTQPEKIRVLALTEPPILPFADRSEGGRAARLDFLREVWVPAAEAFESGHPERGVRLLTDGINGTGPGEASTPAGRERRLRNAQAMHALLLSSAPFPAVDEDALQRTGVPTLLLHGERTQEVHRATTLALSRLMPGVRLMQVADSGHGVHRDNPEVFNRVVLNFLRETLSGQANSIASPSNAPPG